MTWLIIAWRNIWRNGRRTAITVAAISLNTAILIATFALIQGMMRDLSDNVTDVSAGHAQVHADGYLEDRSIYKSIELPEKIVDAAKRAGFLAVERSLGYGLIASGSKSAGASYWGVDPSTERAAFRLPKQLKKGRLIDDIAKGEAVIGNKLARSLHVDIGGELVAMV